MKQDVAHGYCVDTACHPRGGGGGGGAGLARGDFPEAGLAGLVDVGDLLEGEPFGGLRGEFGDGGYGWFLGFGVGERHFEGALGGDGLVVGGEVEMCVRVEQVLGVVVVIASSKSASA